MGQDEENAPLNENVQVPQASPQMYAYPNFQQSGEYYTANGYTQIPVFVPPPINHTEGGVPLRYDLYNNYEYVPPPQALHHPILQRRKDNMGSHNLHIFGVLLGLFFPVLSFGFLCCSRKLRFKRGVTGGQAVSFVFSLVGVIAIGVMVSNQIPLACGGMHSCVSDVSNGTNVYSWSDYIIACNTSSAAVQNRTDNIETSRSNQISAHHKWRAHNDHSCELPALEDFDTNKLGPQSSACATCVCEQKLASCRSLRSASWTLWIVGPMTAFLAIMALYMNKYYGRIMAVESMSVYRL